MLHAAFVPARKVVVVGMEGWRGKKAPTAEEGMVPSSHIHNPFARERGAGACLPAARTAAQRRQRRVATQPCCSVNMRGWYGCRPVLELECLPEQASGVKVPRQEGRSCSLLSSFVSRELLAKRHDSLLPSNAVLLSAPVHVQAECPERALFASFPACPSRCMVFLRVWRVLGGAQRPEPETEVGHVAG